MTNQEAIQIIEGYKRLDTYMKNTKRLPACDMAIEALKKQIPMKIKEIHVDEYFCPACGAENNCDQMIINDRYCPECGQALDSEN